MKQHYENLGLNENATEREIKKAFRLLSQKFHPDKNKGNEEFFTEHFRKIDNSYRALIDEINNKEGVKYNSAEVIEFITNKKSYVVGENVEINWEVNNSVKTIINIFGEVENIGSKTIKFSKAYKALKIEITSSMC